MKRILGIQLVLCSLAFFAQAEISERLATFKEGDDYTKPGGWGLEVFNKTKKPIWYAIKNGNEFSKLFNNRAIGGTESAKQYAVDLGKDTKLALWFSEPKGDVKPMGSSDVAFSPTPDKVYRFATGKTIYVTVDPKQVVRPQTGPLKGLTKKTNSGLSTKNNVKSEDITTIR